MLAPTAIEGAGGRMNAGLITTRVHPVLFEIPFPHASASLGPSLLLLALAGVVVAGLGRRARARDFVFFGLSIAIVSLLLSVGFRGKQATLGPLPIYGFGVMLCAGLVAGWFLCVSNAERDGLPREAIAGAYFVTAASGLFGARVLYVLTNLRDFSSLADALAFRSGGLVFYGGVLGGFVGSLAYVRKKGVSWFAWADVAAPSLALGSMLGRIGCYLAGCDYGLPLGPGAPRWLSRLGTFPRWPDEIAGAGAGSPAWVDQVLYRGLPFDRAVSMPVHPTQLYEATTSFAIVCFLVWLRSHRAFRGQLFLTFVSLYGVARFLLETVRDDPERGLYGPAAIPSVLVAFGFLAMATAFVAGPARSFERPVQRWLVCAVAAALPVVAYVVFAARRQPTSLSTSQWIAISSSLAAGLVWRKLLAAPAANVPERA
jgi:phosphatidylglycerol:prolipoprotein diacylglycerol transferase